MSASVLVVDDDIGQPQIVYVNIRWLRQKIEKDPGNPRYLISVRGVGYKLVAAE